MWSHRPICMLYIYLHICIYIYIFKYIYIVCERERSHAHMYKCLYTYIYIQTHAHTRCISLTFAYGKDPPAIQGEFVKFPIVYLSTHTHTDTFIDSHRYVFTLAEKRISAAHWINFIYPHTYTLAHTFSYVYTRREAHRSGTGAVRHRRWPHCLRVHGPFRRKFLSWEREHARARSFVVQKKRENTGARPWPVSSSVRVWERQSSARTFACKQVKRALIVPPPHTQAHTHTYTEPRLSSLHQYMHTHWHKVSVSRTHIQTQTQTHRARTLPSTCPTPPGMCVCMCMCVHSQFVQLKFALVCHCIYAICANICLHIFVMS